ncbi:MAG TPA: hypothetical protein VF575_01915 [Candidatus Saccharimonadales bacterium]|jgi:hypothetical protein
MSEVPDSPLDMYTVEATKMVADEIRRNLGMLASQTHSAEIIALAKSYDDELYRCSADFRDQDVELSAIDPSDVDAWNSYWVTHPDESATENRASQFLELSYALKDRNRVRLYMGALGIDEDRAIELIVEHDSKNRISGIKNALMGIARGLEQ